jgi:hypothetical protein
LFKRPERHPAGGYSSRFGIWIYGHNRDNVELGSANAGQRSGKKHKKAQKQKLEIFRPRTLSILWNADMLTGNLQGASINTRQVKMMTRKMHTGGLRVGKGLSALNVTWPSAKLVVDSDRIILSGCGQTFEFTPQNLKMISRHSGIFSTGLRFHHTDPNYPEFLVFWCFRPEKLMADIKMHQGVGDGTTI